MENEEPNLVVPRPFLLEPSEVLDRSASLDLTPERVLAKKNRVQRRRTKTGEENGEVILPPQAGHPLMHPDPLSIPHLNSTTYVLDRISSLKQAQQRLVQSPSHISTHLHQLPVSGCIQDMEGVVFNQRQLKVSTYLTFRCGRRHCCIVYRRSTSLVMSLGTKIWCQLESQTRASRG